MAFHFRPLKSIVLTVIGLVAWQVCVGASGTENATADSLHTYSSNGSVQQLQVPAKSFKQDIQVQVFLPPGYAANTENRYPSLYINDGQDSEAVAVQDTLNALYAEKRIEPVIVVAVSMLPDRMGTYGYSNREAKHSLIANTKYGPVGSQAQDYSEWLAHTLVPAIDRQFRTETTAKSRTMLGWSLGAANAFNIGWNYPDVFSRVGGFSPSFFLSEKAGDPSTSVVQAMIASKPLPKYFSVWLAVGDKEETDDRDNDGIIDVMDDAQGVIDSLNAKVTNSLGGHSFSLTKLPGGEHNQDSWKQMLPMFLNWAYAVPRVASGNIVRLRDFTSKFIPARNVDVWLPDGYSNNAKYAVLYMHDGQMLFDASTTWNKQEWRADEVAGKLIAEGKTRPFIIVAVHNISTVRHSEYFPQKPFQSLPAELQISLLQSGGMGRKSLFSEPVKSDAYLKFLVMELKPYIDRHYSVHKDPANTAVMGSSMGGLISLYAISEYPKVFGAAACLSTHWPGKYDLDDNPIPDAIFAYMQNNLPDPAMHRLYFDYGTATLDALYPPLQAKADIVIKARGYTSANWQTLKFEGAEHSENAWAARLDIPLQFLLPPK